MRWKLVGASVEITFDGEERLEYSGDVLVKWTRPRKVPLELAHCLLVEPVGGRITAVERRGQLHDTSCSLTPQLKRALQLSEDLLEVWLQVGQEVLFHRQALQTCERVLTADREQQSGHHARILLDCTRAHFPEFAPAVLTDEHAFDLVAVPSMHGVSPSE